MTVFGPGLTLCRAVGAGDVPGLLHERHELFLVTGCFLVVSLVVGHWHALRASVARHVTAFGV